MPLWVGDTLHGRTRTIGDTDTDVKRDEAKGEKGYPVPRVHCGSQRDADSRDGGGGVSKVRNG